MGLFKKKKIGKTRGTMGRYHPNLEPKAAARRKKSRIFKKLKQNAEKKLLKTRSQQRHFAKIIRPIVIIIIGIVLYMIIYVFFVSDTFTVKKIEFDHDTIEVTDENPVLAYLQNFEGENILLINETDEENYLKETYPNYKTINIKKLLPGTLVLELETYELTANVIVQREGYYRKFIINETGTVAKTDTEDASLPYIYLETKEIIIEGKTAIEPDILTFIIEATENYENKFGMQVLDTIYYKTAQEVHLRTERYFDVWLDTRLTVSEQLGKLKQALPSLNIYEADLRYIDLRISGQTGDKVIYMLN